MNCKCCGHDMHDLTHGKGEHRNWICLAPPRPSPRPRRYCNTHNWAGKWYTNAEWEAYVNAEEPNGAK